MSSKKVFRVIKPEIRVLGIDDGQFIPHTTGSVIVVGVVFRGGSFLDGVMHTKVAIDGLDATQKLAEMIKASPHRRQLRLVMLNGVTLGGFNLVDIGRLHDLTGLPVVALTRDKPDLASIREALKNLPDFEERWRIVLSAGEIHELTCRGCKLYLELAGIGLAEAQQIVELTSTRSCFPEPLRVAHLVASGITP
ncbi:MAG: DUF99 family protein [Candidatus Bathyarchaeota archaeon]|nr:DUF99 family protein [Candidatus Bathyarchaeota archaeon]